MLSPPARPVAGPFAPLRWTLTVVALFAFLTVVRMSIGVPGSRWLAVHLFTLGVLTPAISGVMPHLAAAILKTPGPSAPGVWRLAGRVLAVVSVLVGITQEMSWLTGVGATALTVDVTALYVALYRARKVAVGARFAFVVRLYERACGAFLHGAILGGLLGSGLLPGSWFLPARLAHLHVMVLGWGGVTLLATLTTMGPSLLRTQLAEGAIGRARRGGGRAATAISVASIALLLTGLPDPWSDVLRGVAVLALLGFAVASLDVIGPLLDAARRRHSPAGIPLALAGLWLPTATTVCAIGLATQRYDVVLAALVAVLAGSFGPAILATGAHFTATMARSQPGRTTWRRAAELAAAPLAVAGIVLPLVMAAALLT